MKEQQDQVWEILQVLGMKPEQYNNIFYDDTKSPEELQENLGKLFRAGEQQYGGGVEGQTVEVIA